MGATPLRIRFDKIDPFAEINDETKQLVLFSSERYNEFMIGLDIL